MLASTKFETTTNLVTNTVTMLNADTATVTLYLTPTNIGSLIEAGYPIMTNIFPIAEIDSLPPPGATVPSSFGPITTRDHFGEVETITKRGLSSFVYIDEFSWSTSSTDVLVTTTVVSTINYMQTSVSTISLTASIDAKSITTVVSTIYVDGVRNRDTDEVSTTTANAGGGGLTTGLVQSSAQEIITATISATGPVSPTTTVGVTSEGSSSKKGAELSAGVKAGIAAGAGAACVALVVQ